MSLPQACYISRFQDAPHGHGGNRRTRQMAQALRKLGVSVLALADVPLGEAFEARHPLFSSDPEFDSIYGFNNYIRHMLLKDSGLALLVRGSPPQVAVVDDPVFFPQTMQALQQGGTRVLAVLHNLEAFLPRSIQFSAQWELLRLEVDILRQCTLTVTISREDAFFLENMGVACHFFPYHPEEGEERRFVRIRETRRESDKAFFLTLGTAYNPPTLAGMRALAERWSGISGGRARLIVAGFGTDRFLGNPGRGGLVSVRGGVSGEELDQLLIHARACILHQEQGSGALTKIPELLLAGVPIMGSRHAARSYSALPGVTEYQDFRELQTILAEGSAEKKLPADPPRPDVEGMLGRILHTLKS